MANFNKDMLVAAAMAKHDRAAEVFAGFHLGGCSSCQISHEETIEQVCFSYGVEVEMLLEALESLMDVPTETTA
jgi:hybrid cluster-associated redox disulfide protein